MKRAFIGVFIVFGAAIAVTAIRAAMSSHSVEPQMSADPGAGIPGEATAPERDAGLPELPRRSGETVVAKSLGKLESASEEIGVASDLTGRIVAILVEEGDAVDAGQPLARLDDTIYRARVAAADAALRAAKARKAKLVAGARVEAIRKGQALLEEAEARATIARERAQRGRKLTESGTASTDETDWLIREADAREAAVRASRAELEILQNETRPEDLEAAAADVDGAERELEARKAELDKTVLHSPIRGTVVRRNLRVGEAVSSFQVDPVVTVADLGHLRIRAEVDEIDIGKVRAGQRVRATSESFPDLVLEGKVLRLGKTMGRKTLKSMDPNERQDVRIREVLIELERQLDLPLGLRLLVGFLD